MGSEPQTEEVVIETSDGRVLRYARYLNQSGTAWIRHGRFVESGSDGQVLSEGAYRHGLEVGLWRDFFPSGVKAAEGLFEDGLASSTTVMASP
jgi:antitoxin component YwqK of YwqJK toxin-antitoxin module